MAGVHQPDAVGSRVDVTLSGQIAKGGMPGAAGFNHQAMDPSILLDQIMAADLGRRIPQALERGIAVAHAGIMDQQDVDGLARRPLIVIGRGALDDVAHTDTPPLVPGAITRGRRSTTMATPS